VLRSAVMALLAPFLIPMAATAEDAVPTTQPWGIFWQGSPSHWLELGKILYGEEVGKTITDADVLVATTDANEDTITDVLVYPFNAKICGVDGCSPRLYVFVNDRYHEQIAGFPSATRVLPDDIGISPLRFGGRPPLIFGVETLVWTGSAYELQSKIEPTQVDDSRLIAACNAAENAGSFDGMAEPDRKAAIAEMCGCLSYQLTNRRVDQSGFDSLADNYDAGTLDEKLARLLPESMATCEFVMGMVPWPQTDSYPPRNSDVRPLFNTCREQPWVAESFRVGSAHRAMSLCACIADGVAQGPYNQASTDLITGLYTGEMTDTEVDDQQPELSWRADEIAEGCVSNLRHADYVNGIDRPGSPKP